MKSKLELLEAERREAAAQIRAAAEDLDRTRELVKDAERTLALWDAAYERVSEQIERLSEHASLELADLKLTINGKALAADDLKDFTLNGNVLTIERTLLEDPGYGSGFPAYKFVFQVPVEAGDHVACQFENMAYTAARVRVNDVEVQPANKTRIKGLGI